MSPTCSRIWIKRWRRAARESRRAPASTSDTEVQVCGAPEEGCGCDRAGTEDLRRGAPSRMSRRSALMMRGSDARSRTVVKPRCSAMSSSSPCVSPTRTWRARAHPGSMEWTWQFTSPATTTRPSRSWDRAASGRLRSSRSSWTTPSRVTADTGSLTDFSGLAQTRAFVSAGLSSPDRGRAPGRFPMSAKLSAHG